MYSYNVALPNRVGPDPATATLKHQPSIVLSAPSMRKYKNHDKAIKSKSDHAWFPDAMQ